MRSPSQELQAWALVSALQPQEAKEQRLARARDSLPASQACSSRAVGPRLLLRNLCSRSDSKRRSQFLPFTDRRLSDQLLRKITLRSRDLDGLCVPIIHTHIHRRTLTDTRILTRTRTDTTHDPLIIAGLELAISRGLG